MKILSILAITACLARAFPSQPGSCESRNASPEQGAIHRGSDMGGIADGGIVFTIDGKEADADGFFDLVSDTNYEVVLKGGGATPSFLGFLAVVGTSPSLADSSEVLTFVEDSFPLATTAEGICPSFLGFIAHSNPLKTPITEIKATLKFDGDAVGDAIPLDVNVVVNSRLWYYSGLSVRVTKKPAVGAFCFSGMSMVQVQNKGATQMIDLQVGDLVKVSENQYEPVYAFGHYDQESLGEFLVINNELEVSSDHLVATKDCSFVPASSLKVGDFMMAGDGQTEIQVESIAEKTSKGVFAPFTPSGTIVVNNILASSFVSLQRGDSSTLKVGDASTGLTFHWVAHKFEFPHRLACHYFGSCHDAPYSENGISHWVDAPRNFFMWLLSQNTLLMGLILLPFACCFVLFSLLEALLTVPAFALLSIVVSSAVVSSSAFRKKIKMA